MREPTRRPNGTPGCSSPAALALLAARHGLDGEPPCTLEEIGRALGLTRQAVQQAEARALARLRHPALRRWLADIPTS